jgi:diguanylate cyclase (GGDEF)-like protein
MWPISDEMTPDKLKNTAYMLLKVIPGKAGRASDLIVDYISPECRSMMEVFGFSVIPAGGSMQPLMRSMQADWQKDFYDAAFLGTQLHRVIRYGNDGQWFEVRLQQADESGRCLVIFQMTENGGTAGDGDEDDDDSLSTVNLSLTCSKLMSGSLHIREAMEAVFSILIGRLEADRCLLIETDSQTVWISFEKAKREVKPLGISEKLPVQSFAGMFVPMTREGLIMVSSLDENVSLHPQERRILNSLDVHSYIAVPLYDSNRLMGFLAAVNFDAEKAGRSKNLLRLVAATVAAAVKAENMRKKLFFMSRHDPLTSLKNRQSLPEILEKLEKSNTCAGVVQGDIDGLGKINREKGLKAGDACIVHCAEFLRMYFPTESIYRVDGGNFLVILPGIDKVSFKALVNRVEESLSMNGSVPLEIRSKWCRQGRMVREAVENQLK